MKRNYSEPTIRICLKCHRNLSSNQFPIKGGNWCNDCLERIRQREKQREERKEKLERESRQALLGHFKKHRGRGVYGIENMETGVTYVGKTISRFGDRWQVHYNQLEQGIHENQALQRDWIYFGADTFKFYVIEELNDDFQIAAREQFWIAQFILKEKCYNVLHNVTVTLDSPLLRRHYGGIPALPMSFRLSIKCLELMRALGFDDLAELIRYLVNEKHASLTKQKE